MSAIEDFATKNGPAVQVVDNLVSNAVKYTGSGGTITIGLQFS